MALLPSRLAAGCLAMALGSVAAPADAASDFAQPPSSPEAAGADPRDVAIGDLNGDGAHDLAVANAGSDDVTILMAQGDGDLAAPSASPVPTVDAPSSVATTSNEDAVRGCVGCFQVAAVSAQGGIQVSEGSFVEGGSGNFVSFPIQLVPPGDLGLGPGSLAVGDFNGDGQEDLAVAFSGSSHVAVLTWSAEDGGFRGPAEDPETTGGDPSDVAVGDFNRDGRQDLVTANAGSDDVTVLLGDGNAGFTQAATSPEAAGPMPRAIAVGDFNGDGADDLAVANAGTGAVTILLGDGEGDFRAPASSPEQVGLEPLALAVGDFDNDGDPDLATANSGSNDVTVLHAAGKGDFSEAASSPEPVGPQPQSVAVAELNGDALPDLVTANAASDEVTVLVNHGAGRLVCAGARVIVAGDRGADVIRATPRVDVIAGRGGDDDVSGLADGDSLCGNSGSDLLRGGRGSDRIRGGTGKDVMYGGLGRDDINSASPARDQVACGKGRDRAEVSANDRVRGCERVETG